MVAPLAGVAAATPATSGIIVATGSRSLIAKSVGACATTPCARQTKGPSTAGTEAYVPIPTPAAHAGGLLCVFGTYYSVLGVVEAASSYTIFGGSCRLAAERA